MKESLGFNDRIMSALKCLHADMVLGDRDHHRLVLSWNMGDFRATALSPLPATSLKRVNLESYLSTHQSLPIEAYLSEITTELAKHHRLVLQAPTGTGKTTCVPLALLKAGFAREGQILVLQPRRVAARATAARMAGLLGEPLGKTVGYQVRFEKKATKQTKILVVTEGILTRRFLTDPLLETIQTVILDEFHERSLHSDLAIAVLKELMSIRDDLHCLVMSATLDAESISGFLDNCPIVKVERPGFPLSIEYGRDLPYQELNLAIQQALHQLLADPEDDGGDILIFLPGAGEIRRLMEYLSRETLPAKIVALHGSLTPREQDAVLNPSNQRQIICATNIAETSLTLPRVTAVIDSGYQKQARFDFGRGMNRLDLGRISQASAAQRAGRAGRTAPGRVIRLWSEQRQWLLQAFEEPEIMRVDLASFLLTLLDFHGPDLDDFELFQRPPVQAFDAGFHVLSMVGALDKNKRMTPLGRALGRLPLNPRLASILKASEAKTCVPLGVRLCALLSETIPKNCSPNLLEVLQRFETWQRTKIEQDPSIRRYFQKVHAIAIQLSKGTLASITKLKSDEIGEASLALILAGFPDRVCRMKPSGMGLIYGNRGIEIHKKEGAPKHNYLIALQLKDMGSNAKPAKVFCYLPASLAGLQNGLTMEKVLSSDLDLKKPSLTIMERYQFGNLVLLERPAKGVDAEYLSQSIAAAGSQHFARFFCPSPQAELLLLRLKLAKKFMPEIQWPDVSVERLIQALPSLCSGFKKMEQLEAINWANYLVGLLSWQQRTLLDQELPERLEVPSGSHVRIEYGKAFEATGFPVLAVRLQECFGLRRTPRLAKGRLPVLMHLLAPNNRPVQVTQDLENFWNTTYAEVRKELRQRYPKHAWPENPWQAEAIRGVPRRR